MNKIYKFRSATNAAETWRDEDRLIINEEKYFKTLNSALNYANDYFEEHACKFQLENIDDYKLTKDRLCTFAGGSFAKRISINEIEII